MTGGKLDRPWALVCQRGCFEMSQLQNCDEISFLTKANQLLNVTLVAIEDECSFDHETYVALRSDFLDSIHRRNLPQIVKVARDAFQIIRFCKEKHPDKIWDIEKFKEIVYDEFQIFLDLLENIHFGLVHDQVINAFGDLDNDAIIKHWDVCVQRIDNEPDGAITRARTLLEAICKQILDEMGKNFNSNAPLPKLFNTTADVLNLAPSEHHEKLFKGILSGCSSVVQNIGEIRNKFGDSHGSQVYDDKVASHHAALVANLAGSMALFLFQRWQEQSEKTNKPSD